MEFGWTHEQEMLRASVATLMHRHAPLEYVRQHDRERAFPYALYRHWIEAGLLRLAFPEEYGGLGGSALDLAIVVEEISRTSTDFCMVFSGNVFCGLNILRHGSAAQKAYWLPRLLDGSIMLSIGISEPDAGSDMSGLRCSARRDGDEWVINGQKLWTTGAGLNNSVACLYVRTDPAVKHQRGLSLLLVENDRPGVELRRLGMLGRRCSGTYEMFLRDVRVPADRLVGAENGGWDCLLSGLQFERAVASASNCGGAQGMFDLVLGYSKERKQFGRAIGEFQVIAHRMADMRAQIEAARLLAWQAAWRVSKGIEGLAEITAAKLFSSEAYLEMGNVGMQIMGAFGLSDEADIQRLFRDSRSATIAAGTSEIQRNVLAGLSGLRSK